MKKLFGVMILASVPVACGTTATNPNGPELPSAGAMGEASFAASGNSGRTAPAPCVPVASVLVTIVDQLAGRATLNAQASGIGADTNGTLCGAPTWSVTPQRKGVQLVPSLTRYSAILEAPRGTYVVTVSYPALPQMVSGSATVEFR